MTDLSNDDRDVVALAALLDLYQRRRRLERDRRSREQDARPSAYFADQLAELPEVEPLDVLVAIRRLRALLTHFEMTATLGALKRNPDREPIKSALGIDDEGIQELGGLIRDHKKALGMDPETWVLLAQVQEHLSQRPRLRLVSDHPPSTAE